MRSESDGPTDSGSYRSPGCAPLILAAVGCLGACAREAPPPGSLPDSRPPAIVEVEPERRAIVPGWSGAVKVRFDEPINARQIATTVVGSPANRYDVDISRSQIRIRPLEGDWLSNAVYRFMIPDGISDLLGNRTLDSIEIIFSTGPEFSGSLIEGTLFDRVTGGPAGSGRVIFLSTSGDSVPYTAVSGSDGRFSLPETPFDEYLALAFVDRNASFDLERRFEAYDSLVFTIDTDTPAVDFEFRLTEPDSTPPVLLSVSVTDSVTLRLEFDDHLDPDQTWDPQLVRVSLEETARTWTVEALRLGEPRVRPDAPTEVGPGDGGEGAPPDSLAPADSLPVADSVAVADSLVVADSLAVADSLVVADSLAVADSLVVSDSLPLVEEPDSVAVADSVAVVDSVAVAETLPSTVLSADLEGPLVTGRYRVTATGLRNLRNLMGGGDTTFVYPPPDSLSDDGGTP